LTRSTLPPLPGLKIPLHAGSGGSRHRLISVSPAGLVKAREYAKYNFDDLGRTPREIALWTFGSDFWLYRVTIEAGASGLQPELTVFVRLDGRVMPWKEVK
jgi:hypothetical protein